MSEEVIRKRPVKQFRVKVAYGPYRVGDLIQPTGIFRDVLMRKGVIEEVKDEPVKAAPAPLNRMVDKVADIANRTITLPKRRH